MAMKHWQHWTMTGTVGLKARNWTEFSFGTTKTATEFPNGEKSCHYLTSASFASPSKPRTASAKSFSTREAFNFLMALSCQLTIGSQNPSTLDRFKPADCAVGFGEDLLCCINEQIRRDFLQVGQVGVEQLPIAQNLVCANMICPLSRPV